MATNPLIREVQHFEDFADIIQKVIAISAAHSGGWSELAREIPISANHLRRIRLGKARMGADIFLAFLEHIDLLDSLKMLIDEDLQNIGIKDESEERGN